MSRRWEDGAAGGSRRGGGCRLAVHAAEGGSGDPELPVESLSAADQGERSSVCPVPRGHPASPPAALCCRSQGGDSALQSRVALGH